MHKLIDYACEELEALEKKAAKSGNLSAAEVEYADKLASLKKNLLKGEVLYDEMEMGEYSSEGNSYSRGGQNNRNGYDGNMSYARGRRNARRDSMGRYSREGRGYSRDAEELVEQLRDMADQAPNDQTRMEIERLVQKMERM